MKKVLNYFPVYTKWLLVAPYLVFIILAWHNRYTIYLHIPPLFQETILGDLLLDMVFLSLVLSGFACFFQLLRCPFFIKYRFQKAFKRIGLQNSLHEYPFLISVHKDTRKAHGRIYQIKNMGISPVDFDTKVEKLETNLGLKIYEITYGKKTSTTLLYAIPRKHAKPTIISLYDVALAKDLCGLPNLLCVGKTGSGKSYALSVLLGIYAKYIPNISITICDYKKSSFAHFEDTPNFFGYDAVPDGIRTFYQEFSERLAANDEERNKHIQVLLLDEYGALIGAQDKKVAEELKTMVANMLFMSRSLGLKILVGVQRADSEHFKSGSRDQFRSILGLGNLSREQINMILSEYREKIKERNGLGEGYLLIDGKDIERVKVAPIKNFDDLNDTIRQAMCR
jgi:energy-coupling factor transporter ATP-binding protein EcfA2